MEQIAKEEQRKAWKLQGITLSSLSVNLLLLFHTRLFTLSVLSYFFFLCIHRHRGEIHNMGAYQEGARIITTQSKAEENHYKLYHRWAIDYTVNNWCVCCGNSL